MIARDQRSREGTSQAGDEGSIPFTRSLVKRPFDPGQTDFLSSYAPVVICRRLVVSFNLPRLDRGPSSSFVFQRAAVDEVAWPSAERLTCVHASPF
jgi:hypothetical protein